MRKGKVLRSALAAGMAFALAAMPFGACAETVDETEFLADLQETVEESVEQSVEQITGSASEGSIVIDFGKALYDLAAQGGTDLTWLESVSGYAKIIPSGSTMDAEIALGLNETDLAHLLVSVDETGTVYFSAPDYFEQAIALDPQEFAGNTLSGSTQDDSLSNEVAQMIAGAVVKIGSQLGEFFASLPADVWQQELISYVMPVMSNLTQETGTETLTIGELSAEVDTQTFAIPSEKMGEIISSTLTSISQDQVVESLLQSDAVSSICDLVSQVSGGQVSISGQDLLGQFQGTVGALAQSDFSGMPGIVVTVKKSADGNAAGFGFALEMGGQAYDLLTFGAILDGENHAFEITPGAVLLSMYGLDASNSIDVLGQGSTAGDKLNEEVDILVNGEALGKLTITDYDLAAVQESRMIGTFRFEFGDQSAQIKYDTTEDGTTTIEYLYNDEIFYEAAVWGGVADDDEIEAIDYENALRITSTDDLTNWIGTFDSEAFAQKLVDAGVPAEYAEEDEPAQ